MKMISKPLLLVLLVAGLQGCNSDLMVKPASNVVPAPKPDKATIVFMRSSFVAGAIGVEMFEIENGKLEFIGSLPNGSKIAHQTNPGKKVYMAYGQAADFMIANVDANKTFYSIVRPNWGTGGFAPTPVRKSGPSDYNMGIAEFKQWRDGTDLLEVGPKAKAWFAENKEKYDAIYKDYWARFQTKSPSEKLQRTMNPNDGI